MRFLIDGVIYSVSLVLKQKLATTLTLRRYCRLQLARFEYLSIPASIETKVPLDSIFVTLHLESQDPGRTSATQTNLLQVHRRLIVIGEPGSGKSSLVKWLFRTTCQTSGTSSRPQLPVLVELKDLAPPTNVRDSQLGDWLYRHLRNDAARTKVYEIAACFDIFAATTGLLILLDGLDEVSAKQYPRIERAISELVRDLTARGEHNSIILTMRAQFYQQVGVAYREAFGSTMRLARFSPTDIYEFLGRWPFPSQPEEHQTRLYKDLSDRPTLRDMCRNPLILSMYVAEAQRSGTSLAPETRTEFYSRVADELLIKRRVVQGRGPAGAIAKLREQRQLILGRIALEHLLDSGQPANLLSWSRAVQVVNEVIGTPYLKSEILLRELAKETGIIEEERVGETFRFIHLTLCEFFAALEATDGHATGWSELLNAHRAFRDGGDAQLGTRLVEVIPFASGLLKRHDRDTAFRDLVRLEDRALSARCFLETKYYEHPSWQAFVRLEEQELISTPKDNWDEEWLQRLYRFNVVISDATRSAEHMPTIAKPLALEKFFERLVGTQRSGLGGILETYAAQDAPVAFRLAEVVGIDLAREFPQIAVASCDQEPFYRLAKERAISHSEGNQAWLTVLAEAALHSAVVLNVMRKTPPVEELEVRVQNLDKRRHWPVNVAGRSFFTQCLALSLDAEPHRAPSALDIIQQTEPAPRIVGYASILGTLFLGCYMLMTAMTMAATLKIMGNDTLWYVVVGLMSYPLLALFVMGYYASALYSVYRRLLLVSDRVPTRLLGRFNRSVFWLRYGKQELGLRLPLPSYHFGHKKLRDLARAMELERERPIERRSTAEMP
ncbi:MAG TPA: NACHT domain-containing protein [Thermoanaerobaculia bacterium]|nr:NACHT domain-containing protein [Thermoanaerobaculia bacterium]